MKSFVHFVLSVLIIGTLIQVGLYLYNRDIYTSMKNHPPVDKPHTEYDFKEDRLKLEALQRKEMNEFKWINKRKGYVQIPVERAFDYYLHRLNKL